MSKKKIMAVSSGGGHWEQLIRLRYAFSQNEVIYVTVNSKYKNDIGESSFYVISDATRWNKCKLLIVLFQLFFIIYKERPEVIITTGAALGYIAIRLGRLMNAKTIWIDSIANVAQLSLSGKKIGPYADLWLTQWEHLACKDGPHYYGALL